MSVRAVTIGSMAAVAVLPQSAGAHGLSNHGDGTLGTILYYAEIGLALAFALFLAWMLYDRFSEIVAKSLDKDQNEQQAPNE